MAEEIAIEEIFSNETINSISGASFNNSEFNSSSTNWTTLQENEILETLEWNWIRIIKIFIFTPIVFGAIVGNFLALFAFITRRSQMKSPTHYFVANLALADFLVGILCLPFLAVYSITDKWYFGQDFCFAYLIIHFWLCSSSIFSTCAICIERYIGVKYPLSVSSIMSPKRVKWIIVGMWLFGGILTLASLLIWPEPPSMEEFKCKINEQLGHVIVATVGILYIPAIIMVVLYWQIYKIATKHLKVLKRGYNNKKTSGRFTFYAAPRSSLDESNITICESEDLESYNNRKSIPGSQLSKSQETQDMLLAAVTSKRHINLAKRLVFLVGILLISYVPYFTVFLIRAFDQNAVPEGVFNVFKWIRYSNSCINPFIYAFAVPAYRKAFGNFIFRGKWFL